MEQFIQYAPLLIVVVAFLTSFKLFVRPCELDEAIDKKLKDKLSSYMTPVQFQKERAEVLDHMAKNYVHVETCKSHNEHTMDAIELLRNDFKTMSAKFDHLNELILIRIKQQERKDE